MASYDGKSAEVLKIMPSDDKDPDVLTFEFDDARVLYFFSVITTVTDKPALIETDFLKKLLQLCTKDTQNQKDGVVIRGSSGTGKTFSCVYLWKKLKEQGIPFLVCSTLCLMQTNFLCFEPYIRSFLEDNGITSISDDDFKNLSLQQIFAKIFLIQELQSKNPVFFADLCCLTTDETTILTVASSLMLALSNRWRVVVAYTGGGGWMTKKTLLSSAVSQCLESLECRCDILMSTIFSDKEAKKFIEIFKVDRSNIENHHIEVINNPYFLHCFRDTVSNPNRFDVSYRFYMRKIMLLTERFLSTLSDTAYRSVFNDCLVLLECARHHTSLSSALIGKYKDSYLNLEYLAMLEENEVNGKSHTTLKLIFPPMYNVIVDELKQRYSQQNDDVLNLPIVRGYIFEKHFLQCKDLHSLTILALGTKHTNPEKLIFSSLTTATVQETDPIRDMIEDEIHHLRPKHPAIDGVCVAFESNSNCRYLLLLQVSLSDYRRHESKGIDIRKCIEQAFEGKFCEGTSTIAQYYKKLAKVKEDKRVIYVYVSPNELEPPSLSTFSLELKDHNTTSGSHHHPEYLYGFCSKDMRKYINDCVP